jgi:hypothetical protein
LVKWVRERESEREGEWFPALRPKQTHPLITLRSAKAPFDLDHRGVWGGAHVKAAAMRVPSFLSQCNPATDTRSTPQQGAHTTASSLKSSLSMAKMREAFSFPGFPGTPKFPGALTNPSLAALTRRAGGHPTRL